MKNLYNPDCLYSGAGWRRKPHGTWLPQGAGAPLQPTGEAAQIAVITRTGVGVYLFTFRDKFPRLAAWTFGHQLVAAVATTIGITGVYNAAAGTLSVTVMQESAGTFAAADIAANAANILSYEFTFVDAQVTP